MGLQACVDCGKECSDSAAACPNCGRPLAVSEAKAVVGHVTTEQTSKSLKAQMAGCFLVGLGSLYFIWNHDGIGIPVVPGVLLAASVVWLFVVKLRQWWQHG